MAEYVRAAALTAAPNVDAEDLVNVDAREENPEASRAVKFNSMTNKVQRIVLLRVKTQYSTTRS